MISTHCCEFDKNETFIVSKVNRSRSLKIKVLFKKQHPQLGHPLEPPRTTWPSCNFARCAASGAKGSDVASSGGACSGQGLTGHVAMINSVAGCFSPSSFAALCQFLAFPQQDPAPREPGSCPLNDLDFLSTVFKFGLWQVKLENMNLSNLEHFSSILPLQQVQ